MVYTTLSSIKQFCNKYPLYKVAGEHFCSNELATEIGQKNPRVGKENCIIWQARDVKCLYFQKRNNETQHFNKQIRILSSKEESR